MALFSGSHRSGVTMLAVAWLALLLPFGARAFAEPIYINVIVKDPSQVIKGSVEETIGDTKLPGPLKRLVTFSASTLASLVATPSFAAKRMYDKMPSKMTDKMKGNGLTVKVEPFFQEGT
jgi:hypothetical protein